MVNGMVAKERKQMKHRSCVEEKKVKMKKVRKKFFLKDFEKINFLFKNNLKNVFSFFHSRLSLPFNLP